MKDFKLFDILPNGVIVFKDKKVNYINKYLLDILGVGYFSIKNSIEIILRMLDVKDEEAMFLFLNSHDYFKTKNKTIQISYSCYEDYYIYSLLSIDQSLLKKDIKTEQINDKIYIDETVSKHFKLKNITKLIALTFYKGMPLKKIAKVNRINQDSIELLVDAKHNISLEEDNEIILISNMKTNSSVLHGTVVSAHNNIFIIKNFYLSKEDKHLRNELRVKPDRKVIVIVDDNEYEVYDLSKKGISLYIDTADKEELLKPTKFMQLMLDNSVINLSVKYLKTITQDSKPLKIIFIISTIAHDDILINKYIVNKQNEIIREIHKF